MHGDVSLLKALDDIKFFVREYELISKESYLFVTSIIFKTTGEFKNIEAFFNMLDENLAQTYKDENFKENSYFFKTYLSKSRKKKINKLSKNDNFNFNKFIEAIDLLIAIEKENSYITNVITQILAHIDGIHIYASKEENREIALVGNNAILGDWNSLLNFSKMINNSLQKACIQGSLEELDLADTLAIDDQSGFLSEDDDKIKIEKIHREHTKQLLNELDVYLMLEA